MTEKEIQVLGIHGGRTGDADSLFLKKNCVAIGWAAVGDLSKLRADQGVFNYATPSCVG